MAPEEFIKNQIAALTTKCGGLNFSITSFVRENEYFIQVDGSQTYSDPAMWEKLWHRGFLWTVQSLSKDAGIDPVSATEVTPLVAEIGLGSLFDILKVDYETNQGQE